MSTSTPSTTVEVRVTATVNRVDRTRTPQQVLDATGRIQYTNKAVVATMPSGGTGIEKNVTVEFFQASKNVSDDELAEMLEERGLTDDPYAVAAVNEADPAFADNHPNSTHWKDANGNWCCAVFGRCVDGRRVVVGRYGSVWRDCWWFGGVRK